MTYLHRIIEKNIREALDRDKSILLLGPRQTGKTTLIKHQIKPDVTFSFVSAKQRQRYEQNPALLESELEEIIKSFKTKPIIFIDEVQKIPAIMDIAQYFIDNKSAKFILSGSSARKLKQSKEINLLPGRVVSLTMPPLLYSEMCTIQNNLDEILLYGSLPAIVTEKDNALRETDLYSYVSTYLEDEIRSEAVVRNVGNFSRFLEIAASESGKQVNFTRMSQDIGISDSTIGNYYQILEDCLIAHRIDAITNSHTKRRLIRSPKYLFFDLGIRRICANEGTQLPQTFMAHLFEHYIGNELINLAEILKPQTKLKYWRDTAGPEIDYVLDIAHEYIPIEVKWSDKPNLSDAKHLTKFISEHSNVKKAYIVSRSPNRYKLNENITVLPWQELDAILR